MDLRHTLEDAGARRYAPGTASVSPALRAIGIPDDAAPLALGFFNVGVEAGQLVFIASVRTMVVLWRRLAPAPPVWAWRVPVYLIGIAAAFWFVDRTVKIIILS